MKKVGIIGGSGYTGGELIRLIIDHPLIELDFVYSTRKSDTLITDTHLDLLGRTNLFFTNKINKNVDVLFLCIGHGKSKVFLEKNKFSDSTYIIDLSNDFRLDKENSFNNLNFVYGLPEVHRDKILKTKYVANPGCFATVIQLSLLPLANNSLIKNQIHINATTGSTGAGASLSDTKHFSWRNNNLSWYKPFSHQHLEEIDQTLNSLCKNKMKLIFLPYRGNFTRGIFSTTYLNYEGTLESANELYNDYYKNAPFTHISKNEISLKNVINSNNCFIHLHKHDNILLITSVIDNLIKGASGQAIQNLNIMMGWDETSGLKLKSNIY
ncbi:MAG: N-acetyl-gamma-glutamyl-phosphate reductase [Flavobacteriales bacterium]|nr:N-acetyl-gamma-glutamyl-phosphate reductase [Flavobacteriales bacterium]|tara:strand:+ start:540 stop:1514 length:975 start_codon:yes stop_codon:yes gene_type:complete